MLVIAYPIVSLIVLFIVAAFFRFSSVILKGKSSYGELCGLIGVVGSALMIVTAAFVLVTHASLFGVVALAGAGPSGPSMRVFIYPSTGMGYLVVMPFMQMIMAMFFDLLAGIEKVSIYRSGAMTGLVTGIVTFLIMAGVALRFFLTGSSIGGYYG